MRYNRDIDRYGYDSVEVAIDMASKAYYAIALMNDEKFPMLTQVNYTKKGYAKEAVLCDYNSLVIMERRKIKR